MFPDSRSFFKPDGLTDDILHRVADRTIHPSGVLWGKMPSSATDQARDIENRASETRHDLCTGLTEFGVETGRRPFRLCPEDMTWTFREAGILDLSFTLPSGAFATVVVREITDTDSLYD